MAINISEERVKQVTAAVTKWTEGFKPITKTHTKDDFLSIYEPDIEWYDHGFFIVRRGYDAVLGLAKSFLHCNEGFKSTVKVWL